MEFDSLLADLEKLLKKCRRSQATDFVAEFPPENNNSHAYPLFSEVRPLRTPGEIVATQSRELGRHAHQPQFHLPHNELDDDDLSFIDKSCENLKQSSYVFDEEDDDEIVPSTPSNDDYEEEQWFDEEGCSTEKANLDGEEEEEIFQDCALYFEALEIFSPAETAEDLDDDYFLGYEDDIESPPDRRDLGHVDVEATVGRKDKAYSVAWQLGDRFGWDDKHITLLAEIFVENGYGAAHKAMAYLMERGMSGDELILANELKKFWQSHSYLGMAIHWRVWDHSDATYSGRRIISWRMALRMVRIFPGCDDFGEIEQFIENSFQHWYENDQMRNSFISYWDYVEYLANQEAEESGFIYSINWHSDNSEEYFDDI